MQLLINYPIRVNHALITGDNVEFNLRADNKTKRVQQQQKLSDMSIMAHLKSRSARDKVILDFVKIIVDENHPFSYVDNIYWRNLVYRSHGVTNIDS